MRTPPIDRAVAYVTGKALVWLGKRAHRRGDMHEYHHALAALQAGNSSNCEHGEATA